MWPVKSRDIPPSFFNATMTFRRDSTIWKPYDKFDLIQENERDDPNLVWTEEQVRHFLIYCYFRKLIKSR